MGLDMYLTGRKYFWSNYHTGADERREDEHKVRSMDIDLGYWRKHPDLHGYIVKTFAKNGIDDCEEIELSADNIRDIIRAIKAKALPKTSGFFFGESDGSEYDEDLKILNEALTWLEASDPDPLATETVTKGPGFVAMVLKPDDTLARKPQNITRSVHYRASW
jgi:hypothetical protein